MHALIKVMYVVEYELVVPDKLIFQTAKPLTWQFLDPAPIA